MPAERVLFKQAKSVAFSENLEELKEFLQLIGSNLVLTGPIDEDDARSATEFLARESESLEERQGGDCSRHDGDGRPVGRSILTKTLEIPSLPVHVPILGTSTFSLSSETKRAVTVGGGAPKMNRRRLPVVCVRFPKPFQFLAHSAKNSNWRREWDSNPRTVSRRRFSRPVLSSTPRDERSARTWPYGSHPSASASGVRSERYVNQIRRSSRAAMRWRSASPRGSWP